MDLIGFYREGEAFGCFSNWYPAEFDYAGRHYATSEQFMMYQKVMMFGQFELAEEIMKTPDPEACKILGRTYFPEFDGTLWKSTRYTIVKRGVRAKFAQNPDILQVLLDTGNAIIVECAPRDADWGIKVPDSDPSWKDVSKWQGENLLGRILMEIRGELRQEIEIARLRAAALGAGDDSDEDEDIRSYDDDSDTAGFDWRATEPDRDDEQNYSTGFPVGDISEVDLPELEYIDACDLLPIPEWKARAGELVRIPQFHNAVKAYSDVLGRGYGLAEGGAVANKKTFFFSRTLSDWEKALRAGDCGLPAAGFFELKQEIYDIARELGGAV